MTGDPDHIVDAYKLVETDAEARARIIAAAVAKSCQLAGVEAGQPPRPGGRVGQAAVAVARPVILSGKGTLTGSLKALLGSSASWCPQPSCVH